MSDRDTLAALVARCEQATAEQQDEVMRDVVAHVTRRWDAARRAWIARALDAECYESAALTLVPEGMWWTISLRSTAFGERTGEGHVHNNKLNMSGERVSFDVFAATPALALVAAALRARMEDHA